jgi:DnaJ-class molecular chaperone
VLKKILKAPCGCCFRKGEKPNKNCPSCKGTGIYKDYHYVMIIGKTAIDMDTIK